MADVNTKTGCYLTRRQFVNKGSLFIGGLSVLPSLSFARSALAEAGGPWLDFNKLYRMKLRVKFVIGCLIHDTAHEGPCRIGNLSQLTKEVDLKNHEANFEMRKKQIQGRTFPSEVELLKTVDFKMLVKEKDCEFKFPNSEFTKLEKEIEQTDLLVTLDGFNGQIGIKLAEQYKKPVASIAYSNPERPQDWGAWLVDMTAGLKHKGLEGYLAYDWKDLDSILSLLWVKKAFANTSMLVMTDRFGQSPHGMGSVFYHFDALNKMYGMRHHHIPNQAAADRMEAIMADKAACMRAEKITESLVSNAQAVHMKKENIKKSVYFYQAVKSLMDENNCNCFGAACREICPLEMGAKYKFTPCLAHSLLRDSGHPSVCQMDFNALLAMMALTYISKKSAYMGNPEFYKDNNTVHIWHGAGDVKMKGFDSPTMPYEIRNFTTGGWGVSLKYDFSKDKGEIVTLGRFNPGFDKLLITKGSITKGFGIDGIACALGVEVQVSDVMEVFNSQKEFGSHLVMVYGDYVEDVKRLGKMMSFDVISVGC